MISILMPLYNGVEFLDDSIGSILGQSYREWELLIGINGYSIDGYWSDGYYIDSYFADGYDKIVEKISGYYSDKIRYIVIPTKGKTNTLNILSKEAKYDYICLMDADDYWYPEKLKKQLTFIEKYDVVGSDATYFGDRIGTPRLFLGELSSKMFLFQNPVINSAVMMKKENACWDESWEGLDDYNLWIQLVNQGKTFYNVPEILIAHRIHNSSYFNNKNDEKRLELLQKMETLSDEEREQLLNIWDNREWKL